MEEEKKLNIILDPVQNFKTGDTVLIKGNLIGIIISGWLWTFMDSKKFLYRIMVDAKDCAYRIHNNHIDQTKDEELFREDYNSLLYETEQLAVLELFEEAFSKYEPN
ncbi:hypothetical protein ACM55F_10115 [Flavobacterium sp. XS2P12]|uniref:hypothetical protein n=1 Tax=Flavobacterium melibiosi TaxID=3398734 RepID=UPI003A87FE15